jgi:hypothetical protein
MTKPTSLPCPIDGSPLARITATITVPDNVQLTPGLKAALVEAQKHLARYRCFECQYEFTARDLVEDWSERGAGVGR